MDQQLLNKIELELKKSVPARATAAWVKKYFSNNGPVDLTAFDKALLAPMRELLSRGGKRWRPYLLVLCARVSSIGRGRAGTDLAQNAISHEAMALRLSPAPELLHNATLIVDDFEDRSPERRGGPAIHKIYGEDIALNAANFFYFYPILYAKQKVGSDLAGAATDMIIQEMTNVHLGQTMDIYWHNNPDHPVTEVMYFEMCRLKTGTMARLAARLGVLAGAAGSACPVAKVYGDLAKSRARSVPAQQLAGPAKLGKFAETLGVAFQIRDDLENISPQGRLGKTFGDDITEGKRSLLVIRALTRLKPAAAAELKQILNSHTPDRGQINCAIELINSTDAFEYARQTVLNCKQKALKILADTGLKDIAQLEDLVNQIA